MGARRWFGVAAVVVVVLLATGGIVASISGGDGLRRARDTSRSDPMVVAEDGMAPHAPAGSAALVDETTSSGDESTAAQRVVRSADPIPVLPTRVVKTATLSLDVRRGRLDDAYASVLGTVEGSGGFVAGSSRSKGRAELTLRIPATRFETTVAALRGIGEVTDESVSGEDITAQYVDLESRLRNLRAQEAVLLDLMRRAETVQDSIAVQQQLSGVTAQVEQLEGQRRLLDDQSGFGTLLVALAVTGVPSGSPAQPSTLARAWEDATGVALDVVGGVIVVLGALVPLAVLGALLGLPVWLLLRGRRKQIGTLAP
ncbi:MAG: DUF4349 domain-containing protein [Actinobacteria bacterium]|nr:DUF4349 domain-containing protein [Actinomycetota bacterium]